MKQRIYVPILKDKNAEIEALKSLNIEQKGLINPLIQLVHKYERVRGERCELPPDIAFEKSLEKMKLLLDFNRVFYDPRPLYNATDNAVIIRLMCGQASLYGYNITPVMYMSDLQHAFQAESLEFINNQGICLRLLNEDFENNVWLNIDSLIKKINLQRSRVDVLIDCKVSDKKKLDNIAKIIEKDNNLNEFRSVTFSSGNFPETLQYFKKLGKNILIREDWNMGKTLIEKFKNIKIGYGDYTIQSPIYAEPAAIAFGTRSIIYALKDTWVIMKGQNDSAKNSAKLQQYFSHANVLISEGVLLTDCCDGEDLVYKVSKNPFRNLGNFGPWLQFGIKHHMCLTLRQIQELN